ncbi:MAG: NAD(P)-dependent alcohol dehydrogenase [Gammaproteobacteria bacterium]|nr:NAD(P)-dependent alcohol dehydrogenase [Gammaproteobacteria bacterium]
MNRRDFLSTTALASVTAAAGASAGSHAGAIETRAWEIGEKGDFSTLRLVTRRISPADGEAVVEVTHSALAARDLAIARGWFLRDLPPTLTPLSEGVGRVVAVGGDEQRIKVGDRVTCAHFADWIQGAWTPDNYRTDIGNTADGWLARHALLPTRGMIALPDGVDDETAATMSGSGVTAWHALHGKAGVMSGETVLTLGTGGVSSWGLLLAKAAGARVAVTSSSDEKLELMRGLGADLTVNYKRDADWGRTLFEQTGGVDVVLENVGRPTLDQSMLASGNNARIVMIGTGPLPKSLPKMPGFYMKNLSMVAISNGSRVMLEEMARAIQANRLRAVVGKTFKFEDAPAAFEYMAASGHAGKVLIDHG